MSDFTSIFTETILAQAGCATWEGEGISRCVAVAGPGGGSRPHDYKRSSRKFIQIVCADDHPF